MDHWPQTIEDLHFQHWPRADWRYRQGDSERSLQVNLSQWSMQTILPEIWQQIWQLPNLRKLAIVSHLLTTVPPHIAHMTNLQQLELFGELTVFPSEIGQLINLRDLWISGTFSTFPLEITRLINLHTLGVFGRFTELPESPGRASHGDEWQQTLDIFRFKQILHTCLKTFSIGYTRPRNNSRVLK